MSKVELINRILSLYEYLEKYDDENAELEYIECVNILRQEYYLTLDDIL